MALVSYLVYWEWTVDPGARAVKWVGLRQLAFWDCVLDSRRGHGCLSLVNVVLSDRGLCVGSNPCSQESYAVWGVWLWIISKPLQWGDLWQSRAVVPQKKWKVRTIQNTMDMLPWQTTGKKLTLQKIFTYTAAANKTNTYTIHTLSPKPDSR